MEKIKALFSLFMLIGSFAVIAFQQEYAVEESVISVLLIFFALGSVFYWLGKIFCALLRIWKDDEEVKYHYNKDNICTYERPKNSYKRVKIQIKENTVLLNKLDKLSSLNNDIEVLDVTEEVPTQPTQQIVADSLSIPQEHQRYLPQPLDYSSDTTTTKTIDVSNISHSK